MIPKHTKKNLVALAWYTQDEWKKLRAAATDVDNLEATYDEWVAHACMALKEAESAGLEVVKVVVRIDELVAWCKENGLAMDGRSRARFAAEKVQPRNQKPDGWKGCELSIGSSVGVRSIPVVGITIR